MSSSSTNNDDDTPNNNAQFNDVVQQIHQLEETMSRMQCVNGEYMIHVQKTLSTLLYTLQSTVYKDDDEDSEQQEGSNDDDDVSTVEEDIESCSWSTSSSSLSSLTSACSITLSTIAKWTHEWENGQMLKEELYTIEDLKVIILVVIIQLY
jgi:hypothetical protein